MTDEPVEMAADPAAFGEGEQAFRDGVDYAAVPYSVARRPFSRKRWCDGWHSARRVAEAGE